MKEFKINTYYINKIDFKYLKLDSIKRVYRKKYNFPLDNPYFDHLVKWDIYRNGDFSKTVVRKVVADIFKKYVKQINILVNNTRSDKNHMNDLVQISRLRKKYRRIKNVYESMDQYNNIDDIPRFNYLFEKLDDVHFTFTNIHEHLVHEYL